MVLVGERREVPRLHLPRPELDHRDVLHARDLLARGLELVRERRVVRVRARAAVRVRAARGAPPGSSALRLRPGSRAARRPRPPARPPRGRSARAAATRRAGGRGRRSARRTARRPPRPARRPPRRATTRCPAPRAPPRAGTSGRASARATPGPCAAKASARPTSRRFHERTRLDSSGPRARRQNLLGQRRSDREHVRAALSALASSMGERRATVQGGKVNTAPQLTPEQVAEFKEVWAPHRARRRARARPQPSRALSRIHHARRRSRCSTRMGAERSTPRSSAR